MKLFIFIICLLSAALVSANASTSLFIANGLPSSIPDNTSTGYQNSLSVSGVSGPISAVTVALNISGGYNGDLYLALDYNNSSAVLLNRVGLNSANSVGYQNSGFNITFDDAASSDVHFYQTVSYALNANAQLVGTWQPDGRLISPLASGAAIASAPRGNPLALFDGVNPNGTWTLFAADLSPGGVSTLVGWSLTITTVPEPNGMALMGLAGALAWLVSHSGRQTSRTAAAAICSRTCPNF